MQAHKSFLTPDTVIEGWEYTGRCPNWALWEFVTRRVSHTDITNLSPYSWQQGAVEQLQIGRSWRLK